MSKTQCLFYALDKVHAEGGYIGFGMSTHWELQHAGHYDNLAHEFTSFVPHADLVQPWYSAFGFEGHVAVSDPHYRKPMPTHIIWRGILALAVGFWMWRIKRFFADRKQKASP